MTNKIEATEHGNVEAITQFICEDPENKSIERLEDP